MIEYATAVHKCACGCGKEVVTPLSPTDWKLIFDGKALSLEVLDRQLGLPVAARNYWVKNTTGRYGRRIGPRHASMPTARMIALEKTSITAKEQTAVLPKLETPAAAPAKAGWWKKTSGRGELIAPSGNDWRRQPYASAIFT